MKVMGLVGMLSICSVEDLWKRQIHLVVISAFGILGVLRIFMMASRPRWICAAVCWLALCCICSVFFHTEK